MKSTYKLCDKVTAKYDKETDKISINGHHHMLACSYTTLLERLNIFGFDFCVDGVIIKNEKPEEFIDWIFAIAE